METLGTPEPVSFVPRPFRVRRVWKELEDTRTLELDPADGGSTLSFAPGQFTMMYVFGVGEIPISISGNPLEPETLVHTIRGVGAVSGALCGLKKGDTVGIRGPYGSSWPVDEARGRDVVIVAGGVGLAPLRPVILSILGRRDSFQHVDLVVGARSPETLLYAKDLERWRSRFDLEVRVTVDNAGPDWRGEVGVVTRLLPRLELDPAQTTAFLCGPEVMSRFAATELIGLGVSREDLHLSMERNMKCAIGVCGHCQLGSEFVCKDGPVFRYSRMERYLRIREI